MERLACLRYGGKRKITHLQNVISGEQSNNSKDERNDIVANANIYSEKVKKERTQHIKLTRTDHKRKQT